MHANPVDPLVGTVLERRYLIVERIAQGGMATVYRAAPHRTPRYPRRLPGARPAVDADPKPAAEAVSDVAARAAGARPAA